jgi:hypothetical protein
MSKIPRPLIAQIVENLEDELCSYNIPKHMQIEEYEEIIRSKNSELRYQASQIIELTKEVALLRKSIEDWKIV